MTTSPVTRRARTLALALAVGAAFAGYAALRAVLVIGMPTTADGAWLTAVLIALGAACCWASSLALLARARIERVSERVSEPRRGAAATAGHTAPGAGRWLAALLITVAGWTVSSSAGAAVAPTTAVAAVAVAPARPAAAAHRWPTSVEAIPGVPSPDFAPATGEARPCITPPVPGWTPGAPKAITPADASALLMGCSNPAADEPAPVVVHRGDTLWSIVARTLGPEASAVDVAREITVWHDANRAVIGPDPDLLLAGQVLHAPASSSVDTEAGR